MNERTRYFYLRDERNRPVVTVCEIEAAGDKARGIAICSAKDQFSRKRGRTIAHGRAVKAMIERKDSRPVLRKSLFELPGIHSHLPKSEFDPVCPAEAMKAGIDDATFSDLCEAMP